MSANQLNHIQVCCRIRAADDGQPPSITSYLNNDSHETNKARSYEVMTSNGSFQMDYAFDSGDSQECIFDRIVQPLLTDAYAGFNCSLFSYGQTGSGKTYTLVGNANINSGTSLSHDNNERGIIPRAAETIFSKQASLDPQKVMCQVRLSILEVYQEQLKDLLRVSTPSAGVSAKDASGLRIREQIDGTVWVENLTELVVAEEEEFNRLLNSALKRRVVGAHNMNDVSSRSHFCCILNINQVFHATGVKINSKVHFIDLAGSEMVRKTDATGVRFTEAKHINKSLSALGNVIYALSSAGKPSALTATTLIAADGSSGGVDGGNGSGSVSLTKSQQLSRAVSTNSLTSNTGSNGGGGGGGTPVGAGGAGAATISDKKDGRTHVPYRDSKLTRLLQNSLGGNAKTVIILTISDAKRHLSETLSTLRFGARARQIQTRAVVNRSILEDQALMKKNYTKAVQDNMKLQDLVAELQAELHQSRQHASTIKSGGGYADHSQGDEGVCEICRNFLDLKLRSGDGNSTANAHINATAPPRRPSIREDLHNIYGSSGAYPTPPALIPPGVNNNSNNSNNSSNNNNNSNNTNTNTGTDSPDEYSLVEPTERCAICGLSGDESDKLQMYTGEILGEMFSCDGNCGHQFHVRCVGLVGDGGQYALPDGEWFCTECYSTYDAQESLAGSSIDGHGGDTRGGGRGSGGGGGGIALSDSDDREYSGEIQVSGDNHSSDALYRTLASTDPTIAAAESLKIAPNKNPSSVLATIKAEYHTMRKERNRILAQWQQEKRIIEKYEVSRRIEQQKRDQELINAKDTIVQLESIVVQGEAQSARMQKLFDIMLKELQQSTSNMTTMNSTSNTANSTAIRNSADRLKWASLTVESLLDMPIDSEQNSNASSPNRFTALPSPRVQAQAGSFTRSPKGLQHSQTSPNLNNVFSTSTTPTATASAGIPKPWKGKVRTGASAADSPTPATTATTTASPAAARGSGAGSSGTSPRPAHTDTTTATGSGGGGGGSSSNVSSVRSPGSISPKGGAGGGNTNTSSGGGAGRGAVNSGPARSSAAAATTATSTAAVGAAQNISTQPRRFSTDPTATATTDPFAASLPDREPRRKLSDHSDSSSEGFQGKSKFINPLKNRLKDLLKSVEDETDAFAEIRQKFKSREDERNQLRNSQTLEK